MTKYDRVLIGDFVIYFESGLQTFASLVIDKDDETQQITVDEIFMGKSDKERRKRYLTINQWEMCDKYSQNDLHKRMQEYDDKKLPEKLYYIRLIKLKKLRKNLKTKRESISDL
jgi:formylmethanofuran dehydrogenase subunit E